MEEDKKKQIVCGACNNTFDEEWLVRSCANCFACSGCEIYICPICRAEIVVKPMKPKY